MPDIEIVKLKLRRGTDEQRQLVTLEQGEMGYTTDHKRVWVGDGFTPGGHVTGNLVHAPITVGSRTDITNAALHDIVYDNSLLYQLSGTDSTDINSWAFIGAQTDETTLNYNAGNKLHVLSNSISAVHLNSDVIKENGGLTFDSSNGLGANVDDTTIGLTTTGQLSVLDSIPASLIGDGLSGGSGELLGVHTTNSFTIDASQLEFSNAPEGTVQACAIDPSTVTCGLQVTGNQLGMEVIGGGCVQPFNSSSYDHLGRITASTNAIMQNLSGTDTGGGHGNIFNGHLDDTGTSDNTIVNVLSANSDGTSVTVELSSAGFMQISSGTNGNFAIPVFKF